MYPKARTTTIIINWATIYPIYFYLIQCVLKENLANMWTGKKIFTRSESTNLYRKLIKLTSCCPFGDNKIRRPQTGRKILTCLASTASEKHWLGEIRFWAASWISLMFAISNVRKHELRKTIQKTWNPNKINQQKDISLWTCQLMQKSEPSI